MIYFVVFCAFLSLLTLLRINKLDEDIRHLEMELAVHCDQLKTKIDILKEKLLHVREDYTDQIHDLKHDIYNKVEGYNENTNQHIDLKIEKLAILFQQERIELEQVKKNRSTDTFKSLRNALNPQAQDQTEKKDKL